MERKKIAIITGASSGLGKEFVEQLLANKEIDEIWAIARNEERLKQLQSDSGDRVKVFSIDLSDIALIEGFLPILEKFQPDIRFLVNNAGYAKFCSYDDLSVKESVNMINLNCGAVVAMGLVCIPYMSRGSHIVNIASAASFQPLPYQNIYSATKSFVRSYSRSLHVELRDRGISVTAVCPGWIDTDLFKRAEIGAKKGTKKYAGMTSPGNVVRKALKDAQRGKDMSVYGFYANFLHIVSKILPQRIIMKVWLKQQEL